MSQKVFEALYELIKELEHSGTKTLKITGNWNTYPACPICKAGEDDEHEEDCKLEAALIVLEEVCDKPQATPRPSGEMSVGGKEDKTIYD